MSPLLKAASDARDAFATLKGKAKPADPAALGTARVKARTAVEALGAFAGGPFGLLSGHAGWRTYAAAWSTLCERTLATLT